MNKDKKFSVDLIFNFLEQASYEYNGKTHRIKDQEEYLRFHLKRYYFTLKLLSPLMAKGSKVLDLGSFPFHLPFLLKHFLETEITLNGIPDSETGRIKNDDSVIKFKSEKYRYEFNYHNFNLEHDQFPFNDNSFDFILCLEVIEHLLENPVFMLAEIHRILKPEGKLILTTDNALRFSQVFKLLFNRNTWFRYYPGNPYFRHNREFTLKEINELLSTNGFKAETIRHVNINMADSIFKSAGNLLFSIITWIPLPFFWKKKRHIVSIWRKVASRINYPHSIYIKEPDEPDN
ncbi:MAG TPA: SAM-dependent methyltransferase [Firmicutes bacterium]|nr:SAM-dependent methyltransferase [Bacillota bacterium]